MISIYFVGFEDDKTVGLLGALRIYIVSSNSKNIRKKLEMNLYVEIPIQNISKALSSVSYEHNTVSLYICLFP